MKIGRTFETKRQRTFNNNKERPEPEKARGEYDHGPFSDTDNQQ